jgi:hypothetical protein
MPAEISETEEIERNGRSTRRASPLVAEEETSELSFDPLNRPGFAMSSSTAIDTRICLRDGVQMALASARDDHFVSTFVQLLSQPATYARSAAGNEDGVSREIHDFSNEFSVIVARRSHAYPGKLSPNMGRPPTDCFCVASSCNTSQCSAKRPSSKRTMSAAIQAAGLPIPEKRPCGIT